MKRKLFLLLCALLTMIGVQAQVEPANDGIYYLYNEAADLFLARGNSWGTQGVAMPVGMPWKISVADGKYTLRMYDLTVAGSNSGFGDNAYTDNGSPIQLTPIGTAEAGYKLQYGSNYITSPATAGAVSLSGTASVWQFLTQAQYAAKLAARAVAQESAVAQAKGIEIPAGKTLSEVVGDADNWASTYTNDGTPASGVWTVTGVPNRGGNQNWGSYGGEIYQGGGRYTKTITGLKAGIYKVSVRAQKRVGSNGNCYNMGQAGYPVSDAYLSANGNIIPIKAWYEDCVNNGNPNSTGEFVSIVNNGGYTTEGFVYVGNEGTLQLAAVSEAYWGSSWFLFNGISYTFYNNEVSDEDAAAIIATANGIVDKKMGDDVHSALSSAITVFEASKTIANYNALNTAISNANTSIASYTELATAIANAQNNTVYKTAFPAGTTIYNDAVTAAQGVYDASEVDDCSAAINALTNGIHAAYESDYGTFANDYAYDYSTLLNPDLTKWASSDYVVMTANEHWNGQTGQRYYEQSSAEWGQASWSHEASQTATLPAGNYVMSITARASADVTSSMSVTVGNSTPVVVSLANKGAGGRGIMTNGVGSYQDGTYANGGAGYGWEYRYIAFTVEQESPVTFKFNSSVNNHVHNWVSIANPLLKGDVHPNQIKLNQIHALADELKNYEGQITAETYATFADDLAAAAAATVESTNLDDIIVSLQNDIETAQAEKDAFARGAAMNALISGDNSVVLNDEATAANWTPVPTYNDWSTEADESGMVKPFLQDWVAKEQSPLADNGHNYASIRGLQNGYYEVSALVRIYAENGDAPSATSATFTVNGTSDNLLDGKSFEFNSMKGIYKTVTIRMQVEDALNIGLAYSGATFNWISWKNLKVTYLCNTPADAADYTALNAAIETAEGKTLGFEEGEYAPYNNIEALQALADAKAIDQTVVNSKSFVQSTTAALTGATWTANVAEVNAIYNGTFALCENDGAQIGWVTDNAAGLGGAYHARAFVLTSGMTNYDNLAVFGQGEGTRSASYFRFDGTNSSKTTIYTYGVTEGYTMPLENAIYRLTAQVGGWGQESKNITVQIVNSSDDVVGEQTVTTPSTGVNAGGSVVNVNFIFNTSAAGNYKLRVRNGSTDADNAIVMSNLELKKAIGSATMQVSGTAKMGTFCAPFDVAIPEGVTAYEASMSSEEWVHIEEIKSGVIDAGTPVILSITANTTFSQTFYGTITTENPDDTGVLKGLFEAETLESGVYPYYIMQYYDGKTAFFCVPTGQSRNLGANRCYLLPESNETPARIAIGGEEDDPTAINEVKAIEAEAKTMKDGKYLVKGRIVIVKEGKAFNANGQKLN